MKSHSAHSTSALLGGSGNIGGYYTTDQPADVERLARVVYRLEHDES